MPAPLRILGIDPGLGATGWGVIELAGSRLVHLANGTVVSAARLPLAQRLVEIETGLA